MIGSRAKAGKSWRRALACLFLFLAGQAGRAQGPAPDRAPPDDLAGRIERLEKQNERLQLVLRQRSSGGSQPDTAPSDGREGGGERGTPEEGGLSPEGGGTGGSGAAAGGDGREGAGERGTPEGGQAGGGDKKADDKDKWIEVGKNLGMKAGWINYQPWLESEDKAFRIHIGGRTQIDAVWADAPNNVQFGRGGIGKFTDAVNFRRARLQIDGWFYEVFDFYCEYDFVQTTNVDPTVAANENNTINTPSPTDLWGGFNFIPWIGTIRIGNMKNPIGLDHIISSRYLDFMERAAYFDTYFNRNNGFEPGIQILNWTKNERVAWHLGVFKNNETIFGWNPGNGEMSANARITALPWFEFNGRYMIHLGLGVQYDAPDNGVAILRDRWLLRNGPPTLQNTVALAAVSGHNQFLAVPEFFMNLGPFSMQAEYLVNHLDQVSAFVTQPQGAVAVPGGNKSYLSQSAYVQALYFLTGEHRPYNRTGLHASGASPTRVVPFRNFFYLKGHCCPNPFSSGAWQIGIATTGAT